MSEAAGQLFRRVGLLFEVASMLIMLATHRGNIPFWNQTGLDPNVVLPMTFFVGVLLWTTGTIAIRRARRETER